MAVREYSSSPRNEAVGMRRTEAEPWTRRRDKQLGQQRRGAVIVLLVLLLPVVLLMCAFAINLAYVELARTEMVIAADAAARAGGRELAVSRDQTQAIAAAKNFASRNEVAGRGLTLSNSDIVFGRSVRSGSARYAFTAGGANPNALRVLANRSSGSSDGAVPLLMPNMLGRSTVDTTQEAISTLMEVDVSLVIDRSGSMAFAADEVANPLCSACISASRLAIL